MREMDKEKEVKLSEVSTPLSNAGERRRLGVGHQELDCGNDGPCPSFSLAWSADLVVCFATRMTVDFSLPALEDRYMQRSTGTLI